MNTQNNDARLMQGHPGDTSQQPAAAAASAAVATPLKKKIFVGQKVFDSEESLVQYTKSLETKVVDAQLSQPVKALEQANKPKISQLIFEDPETYTEATIQEAERRVESRLESKRRQETAWTNFYEENPDLVSHKPLVEMAVSHRREEYKNLSSEEGLSKIAVEVRDIFSKIKGTPLGGKELSSSPAIVAGSGNGNTTAQVAPTRAAPITMVEAMQRQKQKKGKS